MTTMLAIFIGGGLGAASRYGLAAAVQRLVVGTRVEAFPLGILACNLLGCLAIGFAVGCLELRDAMHWSPFLITGFLGGFTTFSAFGKDTHALMASGFTLHAALNIALSVGLGVGAVIAGLRASQLLR